MSVRRGVRRQRSNEKLSQSVETSAAGPVDWVCPATGRDPVIGHVLSECARRSHAIVMSSSDGRDAGCVLMRWPVDSYIGVYWWPDRAFRPSVFSPSDPSTDSLL